MIAASSDATRLEQRIEARRAGEEVRELGVASAPLGMDDEAANARPQAYREHDVTEGELFLGGAEGEEENGASASSQPSAGTW